MTTIKVRFFFLIFTQVHIMHDCYFVQGDPLRTKIRWWRKW